MLWDEYVNVGDVGEFITCDVWSQWLGWMVRFTLLLICTSAW